MSDTRDRAKRLSLKISETEASAQEKSDLAKDRAKTIIDSGVLDYNGKSATLKKELATALSNDEFDAQKVRPLVENYAAVQFKIYDDNLKKGHTGIKPIGENISSLFKAHGKSFEEIYPDLSKNFSTGNIEAYAYHTSPAVKDKYNKQFEQAITKDAVIKSFEAINDVRESAKAVEEADDEDSKKINEYNAELKRLNESIAHLPPEERRMQGMLNRQRAAQKVGYLPSNVGFTMSEKEAEARKQLGGAKQSKVYADESLFSATTMLDVMKMPDFEKNSVFVEGKTPEGIHGQNGIGRYYLLGKDTDFKDVEFKDENGKSYTVKANSRGYTEEQYKTIMYLLNTIGTDAADKYVKGIENTVRSVAAQAEHNKLQSLENGSLFDKMLSGFGQGLYAFGSGVEGIAQSGAGIVDTFTGGTDYFMPGAAQMITAKNKENASTLGRIGLGAVEGIPQVAGTAALGAINPVLGTAFLGGTAYGSSYVDAINSGATKGQAIAMGTMNAALEIALERFVGSTIKDFGTSASEKLGKGLSKTKLGTKIGASFDNFAKVHPKRAVALHTVGTMFGNTSSEFMEEYLAETAAPIIKYFATGEDGKFSLWSEEQREAGLIGFITGAVLEGVRGGVTLSNLGTDYGIRVETIKSMPDSKVLSEFKAKFGSDAESAKVARAFLLDSERFIASTVAVSEYAKEGLSYEEAVEKAKKQGIDISGFEEFAKAAYEIGETGAVSPAGLSEKLTYKGGAYNDISRLIESGEASDYIADRITSLDKSIAKSEAVKAVNEAKQRAFARSLENTMMSDFEKSNAIKKYVLKEEALDRMYRLGEMGLKFDASMSAGLLSEADAYRAFTRGENARILSSGQSIEVGSINEIDNVSKTINEAQKNIENKIKERIFEEAPTAPVMAEEAEISEVVPGDVDAVISGMGSMGRTLYNKVVNPIAGEVGKSSELKDAVKGFAHVYEAGFNGVNYKRSMAGPLHIKEINAIYAAGKKDAAARVKVNKKSDAKVIKDESFKAAKVSKRTERILDGVSKIVGRDIRFSDKLEGNAKIDLENGEIIISTKAKSGHTWAMIHEVYHALVIDSPAEAEQLKKTVLDIVGKNEAAFKRLLYGYSLVYANEIFDENGYLIADAGEYLTEEMTADLVGYTLSEPSILEKLTGQQRNVLQKFVDKLVSIFGNEDAESKAVYFARFGGEYKAIFKDVAREADSIAEQFKAALDTSQKSEKNTVERDGVVRHSKAVDLSGKEYWQIDTDKDIFKNLSETKDLQNAAFNFILKGDKGERVTDIIDGEELQFRRVSASEYLYGTDSKTLDSDSYKQKMRMSPSILDLIENATITYDSPDIKNNKKFPDGFKNYQGRVGIDDKIFRYIVRVGKATNGKVFYDVSLEVDDVKVHRANGTSLINKSSTSNKNYTQKNGNVNRNSRDITEAFDNNGKKLAEKQLEYFANSKVRDKNGNLKVMYRGDANEITVFDRKKSKPSNLYGRGFYFTDSKNHAEQYGKATEYYLNIENPLMWNQNKITKKQILDFLKVIENDGEDYDLYNYGQDATAESVLDMVWGKGDLEMLQDINAGAIGDLVAAVELFNEVNGTNYDGFILPSETVTFSSEQAKLTSNLNPTKNPDTRYSKELFPDDRTMSAEEIERDEIEQYIQQIKSSDDLSDADVQAIREEITQSRKQQREQLLAEIATTNLKRWGAELGRQEESGKVLSINEAIKKVEESFGVKVTSGGDASVSGRNVSSYNESTRTIRTKFKNDLPAVCHALGYHIDKKLGVVDKVIEQTAEVRRQNGDGEGILEQQLKRMVKLEGKDSRKAIKEGFAEFIRMYLVAKNLAQEAAPIFYSEFESMLKEDAELQKAVETSAEIVHGYFMQNAEDRGGAAIMSAEDWKQFNKPRGKEAVRNVRDWVVVRLFDRFYGIKSAEKKQNVFDLSTSKSAYVKATLSLTARAKAARLLDDGFYDVNGNKIGEGFFDIIEALGAEYSDKFKAFGDYLSFVHALEWIEPNKVAGKKTSSGKDIYNAKAKGKVFADETLNDATELKRLIGSMESKYPDFKGIAERIYKYQDNLMNYYLVPSGALSQDQAETFKAQYPHYVPFNRFNTIFGEATKSGKGGNNYFGNLKNPIQKADGGNAPIRHPLESIINSTFSAVDFYMKNDTMKAMIEEFTGNGALPGVMERIYSTEELKKLDEKGNNPFDVEEGKTVDEGKETAFSPVIDKEKGIVYAWVNGEKRFYQIYDRGLYNAVANLEVQNLGKILRMVNSITNALKVTMTMRNPLFGPGNFYRDFMTFHYNTTSNANILMQIGMYAGALKSIMKNDADYQLYKALGGGDMGKFTADVDAIKRTVSRRNSKAIKWNEMSARDFGQKVIKNVAGLKFLWDKFFELNDVFETLPRLAEFKYTMESTHGDEQLAMYRSQDVTTNFSRSGSWGRNLNAIFLFSNAELQGIDKMVRNYTEAAYTEKGKNGEPNKAIIAGKILKTVGWSFFMMALQEFINRRDDEAEEEYSRLSEFIKNNYDVFYIGNGYFAKVPKEQNLAIPRTVMQRIFDAVKGDDVDFRELGSYIWDGITPGFVPDVFDIKNVPHQILNNTPISVFTDVMANRDFKGAEIVPSELDGPEYLKYNNYTSALSVGLAKRLYEKTGFDISPMALDHYIGAFGYWGTLFTDLFPHIDYSERGFWGSIGKNWFNALGAKTKFSVDARYSTDLLNDFYEGRNRAEARLGIEANGENRLVNERYKVLGSFIKSYNKQSRNGSEEQQRLDRKMLQVILEGFDEGKFSEGERYVMKLYDATGNEAVFVSSFPGPTFSTTTIKKGKKFVTEAVLDANAYAEFCNEISEMREAVRVLVKGLGLDESDAADFLAKEYSNINSDIKEKYLSIYGTTVEAVAEKQEKKFNQKAYEKAYEEELNRRIYGE